MCIDNLNERVARALGYGPTIEHGVTLNRGDSFVCTFKASDEADAWVIDYNTKNLVHIALVLDVKVWPKFITDSVLMQDAWERCVEKLISSEKGKGRDVTPESITLTTTWRGGEKTCSVCLESFDTDWIYSVCENSSEQIARYEAILDALGSDGTL